MSDTLRGAAELVDSGLLAPEREAEIAAVADRYAISITRDVAALIDPADAADPIARQFVPDTRELVTAAEERADPIGESSIAIPIACC
jgi:lysine 2,3-aminomutase